MNQNIEVQEFSQEKPWEKLNCVFSNLLITLASCDDEEALYQIEENIKEYSKTPEGFLQLAEPLDNRTYHSQAHIFYLTEHRPSHGGVPGRSYTTGYPCSTPPEFLQHIQLEEEVENLRNIFITNVSKNITTDIIKKIISYKDIHNDIVLTFLCKICSVDIIIQCLEQLTNNEIFALLNGKDLMISAIHNKRYSNEIMNYLLTRGWIYEEKYLLIAIQVGNKNAVLLLLEYGFLLTEKLFNKAVYHNYPDIVEILVEYSQTPVYDFGNKLISMSAIEYIFEHNSLELFEKLLKYTDLVKLGFENYVFQLLILKNWCKSYSENHPKHCDKSAIVLFLIQKGLEINLTIDLKTIKNQYIRYYQNNADNFIRAMCPKIREILLYYSGITDYSIPRRDYLLNISQEKFAEIVSRRNVQIQLLQNDLCWSQRKSFALFREGLVKNANKLEKKPNRINKNSVIVSYNRRFSRHILSFIGVNLLNTNIKSLDDGTNFLNKIKYVN
jgi:hypothetical protein